VWRFVAKESSGNGWKGKWKRRDQVAREADMSSDVRIVTQEHAAKGD
jgi:hypothetical protein